MDLNEMDQEQEWPPLASQNTFNITFQNEADKFWHTAGGKVAFTVCQDVLQSVRFRKSLEILAKKVKSLGGKMTLLLGFWIALGKPNWSSAASLTH